MILNLNWTQLPIDVQCLETLADGDMDFALTLLQLYCEDCAPYIDQLRNASPPAQDPPDYDRLYTAAHYLVGSSSNVGATRIYASAKIIETQAKAQQPADYAVAVDTIISQIRAIQTWLTAAV